MSRGAVIAALSLVLLAGFESAGSAADEARRIVDEVQRRGKSMSLRYNGLLQSFDSGGKTSEKRWTFERTGSHGQSKSVIRFTAPPEVRGVALLVVNHPDKASDQWMWTPALERDRRIALQDRSTRFFGTDFSFEDLEERDAEQYTYALKPDQVIDGVSCWTIESRPRESKSSQYTKSIVWVRKDNYGVARIDSYIKDEVVRRLNYQSFENIQGVWTARELRMTDLRRGGITRLVLENVQYNAPLQESDFTLQALRRQ
jgi:hypothetical protein